MNSPVVPFVTDIVGLKGRGQAGHDRERRRRQGQQADDQADPKDGGILDKLAMPFFCAIPTNTPHDPKGVTTLPGAARTTSRVETSASSSF